MTPDSPYSMIITHLEDGGLPELGRQVPVGLREGEVDGLDEVTKGTRVATGRGVAVLHASLWGDGHRDGKQRFISLQVAHWKANLRLCTLYFNSYTLFRVVKVLVPLSGPVI